MTPQGTDKIVKAAVRQVREKEVKPLLDISKELLQEVRKRWRGNVYETHLKDGVCDRATQIIAAVEKEQGE